MTADPRLKRKKPSYPRGDFLFRFGRYSFLTLSTTGLVVLEDNSIIIKTAKITASSKDSHNSDGVFFVSYTFGHLQSLLNTKDDWKRPKIKLTNAKIRY